MKVHTDQERAHADQGTDAARQSAATGGIALQNHRADAAQLSRLQSLAHQSPRGGRIAQLQAATRGVVQRTDLFGDDEKDGSDRQYDSDGSEDHQRRDDGPLPILNKTGDGAALNDDDVIEEVQLRGGRGAAHSEIMCTVVGGSTGVLRFSRNQGGDTFQRGATVSGSSWSMVQSGAPSGSLTVAQAESLATQVHGTMTLYLSGDCHDFADALYTALTTGSVPIPEDDFM